MAKIRSNSVTIKRPARKDNASKIRRPRADANQDNLVGWFEIPVKNMRRAIEFYEHVFTIQLHEQKVGDLDMAFFPWNRNGKWITGSLVLQNDLYVPSFRGVLIYFICASGDLDVELTRAEAAGGKIVKKKYLIGDKMGYAAIIRDTEGNRIGLHSMS